MARALKRDSHVNEIASASGKKADIIDAFKAWSSFLSLISMIFFHIRHFLIRYENGSFKRAN